MRAPFARYMCTRPVPDGTVNSASSTPMLRNTHSISSTSPVEIAILGNWVPVRPSVLFLERRVYSAPSAALEQAWEMPAGTWITRRHLPALITSSKALPTGMRPSSVKRPR